MQLELSAGKQVIDAKRVKMHNRCQARETSQPVPTAGKRGTGTKLARETPTSQVAMVWVLLLIG